MRILLANDQLGEPGGVQSYLDAIAGGLAGRGHTIAVLHWSEARPFIGPGTASCERFTVAERGLADAIDRAERWQPDVCFSNNMKPLAVDTQLATIAPVVKFMHGFMGTCVGGQKRFSFPASQPCQRRFGASCLAWYGVRHCGQLSVTTLLREYHWARQQRALFARYRAIVVASEYMKREYAANGVNPEKIHVNPLFPTHAQSPRDHDDAATSIVFLGRMTALKGGDLLIRAIADAARALGRTITLVMVGDGPQRTAWERLAADLGVSCRFVGWQSEDERWQWLTNATLLALPSTWPEPFGLVGLEAAALGVPAIAFDVGGVREWLRPGENGYLVDGERPRARTLAEGLLAALRDPVELRARRHKALAVARDFSLEHHLRRLEQILSAGFPDAHPAGW